MTAGVRVMAKMRMATRSGCRQKYEPKERERKGKNGEKELRGRGDERQWVERKIERLMKLVHQALCACFSFFIPSI